MPEFGTVAREACHLSVVGVAVVDRTVKAFFIVPLETDHIHFGKASKENISNAVQGWFDTNSLDNR